MLNRLALFLRPRRRQVGWSLLLGISGIVLLVLAASAAGFGQDLLVNIGASLLMVALTFIVFDPVFEDLRRNAVEEHRTLNHDLLVANVAGAHTVVDIMETWTGLLEDRYRERFLAGMGTALERGVQFRVLLLDPDSAAAEQRTEELNHTSVQLLIMDNLRHLSQLSRQLDRHLAAQLQVRVYDALPSIQLYRWDEKAMISFFPVGVRAYDAPQIEAFVTSPLGEFVEGRFEDLWASASTRPMDDFMTMPLTIRHGSTDLSRRDVQFVRIGDSVFVDGTAFVHHLADHGTGQLTVLATRPLEVGAWVGTSFDIVRVDVHDRPGRADVISLLDAKYGPTHHASVVLRLVPKLAAAAG